VKVAISELSNVTFSQVPGSGVTYVDFALPPAAADVYASEFSMLVVDTFLVAIATPQDGYLELAMLDSSQQVLTGLILRSSAGTIQLQCRFFVWWYSGYPYCSSVAPERVPYNHMTPYVGRQCAYSEMCRLAAAWNPSTGFAALVTTRNAYVQYVCVVEDD
jgi:hypothetical protein